MRRTRHTFLLVAALAALALPSVAHSSPAAVIRDCADDGRLDGNYSNSDLRRAARNLPADLDEYSDCRSVIAGAVTAPGGGGGGPRARASRAPNPKRAAAEDAKALDRPRKKPKLKIGGETVEPGTNNVASASYDLPLPLLLALIALGVLAAGGGVYTARRRLPALANLPLLNKISFPRVRLPRFRR
jgi:hypothetical protein